MVFAITSRSSTERHGDLSESVVFHFELLSLLCSSMRCCGLGWVGGPLWDLDVLELVWRFQRCAFFSCFFSFALS